MNYDDIRHILMRAGAAFVFVVFGIWEILQPQYWTPFVPAQLSGIAQPALLVTLHGVALLVIGVAIAAGAFLTIFSVLGTLAMLEIVVSLALSTGFTDLLVRDISLLALVASLIFDKTRYLRLTKR